MENSNYIICKYCRFFDPSNNGCYLYTQYDHGLDESSQNYAQYCTTQSNCRCSHFSLSSVESVARDEVKSRADGTPIVCWDDFPEIQARLEGNRSFSSSKVNSESSDDTVAPPKWQTICVLFLIACVLAWLFLPFCAIIGFDLEDPRSCLQIALGQENFSDTLEYDTLQFWCAIVSAIGFAFCFFLIWFDDWRWVRYVSLGIFILLSILLIECHKAMYGPIELFDIVGSGFWCMYISTFLIFCIAKKE